MSEKAWDKAARFIGCLWVADFILLFITIFVLGGDALSGHAANGHYFVGYKSHFTEVSREAYLFSWWQVASLAIVFPLFVIAAFFAGQHKKRDIQY